MKKFMCMEFSRFLRNLWDEEEILIIVRIYLALNGVKNTF